MEARLNKEEFGVRKGLVLTLMLILALGIMPLAAPPDNFGALPNDLEFPNLLFLSI